MKTVIINGEPHQTQASDLATLLSELGYEAVTLATAVNGRFVAQQQREQMSLSAGMQIDILQPMQGG